jgi:hypothetical protein
MPMDIISTNIEAGRRAFIVGSPNLSISSSILAEVSIIAASFASDTT